ncbi:MAG: acyltransferase [Thermodesulfobacteriota bacterium]
MKNFLFIFYLFLEKIGIQSAASACYGADPIRYLRLKGAKIGERCRIYSRYLGSEPYLLSIGDHVSIGQGVQLITHDGAIWVLRELENKQTIERFAPIVIGNNVYIGNESLILPGVCIGNNVIIGANSVVTKDLPSDGVYGGVPVRRLCAIADYKAKHMHKFIDTKNMQPQDKKNFIIRHLSCEIKEEK